MIFKNSKVYDVLKWLGSVVIPAFAVLVATLGEVWGMTYAKEISATCTALAVFLNALLGISSIMYQNQNKE